ncbi:MAG: hypothetical protein J6O13_00455 [Selenomonas sp.]|nr:hypothetical protein [Selenomonas sp.]
MGKILEAQQALFSRWQFSAPKFIRDGIVNEQAYLESAIKLLFLFDDIKHGHGDDICAFIRAGAKASDWDNVTRWTRGVRNLHAYIPWERLKDITSAYREAELNSVAVISAAKSAGNIHTIADIEAHVHQDKANIKKQIEIYNPELIICCGAGWVYEQACGKQQWKVSQRGVKYAIDGQRTIIAYYHPCSSTRDNILYYGLTDALKEIFQKKP